jgi:CBS domain-containing protein
VVDGTGIVGLVSERDLFALQRVSMRQVKDALRGAHDRPALLRAAADIRALTRNLLAQGAAAEPLTRTIAALNDVLSRQVIEMVLARHDLADSDWCWLALGSEGRGEQTFATDQDNAMVFAPRKLRVRKTSARASLPSRATSTPSSTPWASRCAPAM